MTVASLNALRFGAQPRDVSRYAKPCEGNGNEYLRMYQTQPKGLSFPWIFAHHENVRGAVHVVPVVPGQKIAGKKNRQFVHLLVMARFPLGGPKKGCLSIELPAGLWGDHDENETPGNAAARELKEETGYKAKKVAMLSKSAFATSSGMTTEEKSFAVALTQRKRGKTNRDDDEKIMIRGDFNVPIGVFMDPARFERWVAKQMAKQFPRREYLVSLEIPAARGLMPKLKHGRLDISG